MQGWEPREVTRYVRDADGRVLEAVTEREAEFDAAQVALLVAHLRSETQPRGPHGVLLSEATDPALDPAGWKPGGPRIEVHGPKTDWVAQRLDREQKAYYEKYPNAPRDEHLWSVRIVKPDELPAAE